MFGDYQNNIKDLPSLELYRYENIFKVYQIDDKNFYFYNIIKNIKAPNDIDNNIFQLITYNGTTPFTTLSYQIYGTTYLWWLICVLNNIQNPFDSNNAGKQLKILKPQYLKPILDSIKSQLQ